MNRLAKAAFITGMFCLLSNPNAQSRPFGLGLVLGEPTGISAKLWTDQRHALSFALGWWGNASRYYHDDRCYDPGFYRNNRAYCRDEYYYGEGRYGWGGMHLHADYLIHHFEVIKSPHGIPLYYGPGLNVKFWDYSNVPNLGVRGVGGIAFIPKTAPIDIFLEIGLVFQLFPGPWLDGVGGLGIRYFF